MKDSIENYSIKYHAEHLCFVFRGRQYPSLAEFVKDPEYRNILKYPLSKTTPETIKVGQFFFCSS
jgi:hypothetical protein